MGKRDRSLYFKSYESYARLIEVRQVRQVRNVLLYRGNQVG